MAFMTENVRPMQSKIQSPTPQNAKVIHDDLGNVDPAAFLRSLWRYRWASLGITLAVAAAAWIYTSRQTPIYEAVTLLEFEPAPSRPLGKNVETDEQRFWDRGSAQMWMDTQSRILASRTIASVVVRKLQLHLDADFMEVPAAERAAWQGASIEAASMRFQSKVKIKEEEGTRLINLSVRDPDPKRAALLANALADSYLESAIETRLSSTVHALDWLRQQLENLKGQLEQSEIAVHSFKKDNHVLSIDLEHRQGIITQQLQEYTQSLTEVRTERIRVQARLKELQAWDQSNLFAVLDSSLAENDSLMSLRNDYRRALAERDALAVKYGSEHPDIKVLNGRVQLAEGALRAEINGAIQAVAADLRRVEATEQGLQGAINEVNRAGLDLNLKEIEYGRLSRERENNARLYGVVLERTADTDLTRMLRTSYARIVERALVPMIHVYPREKLNVVLGAFAGLILSLLVCSSLSVMDRRVRKIEDIEAMGVPVLGLMPSVGKVGKPARPKARKGPVGGPTDLVVHTSPRSPAAECCRTIRTNLAFLQASGASGPFLVTSPSPLEGKTTLTLNLATTIAQSGKRVLLVDADLRRPRLHRALGLSSNRGITAVLIGELSIAEAVQETQIPGVHLLACGPIPPNPAELIQSQAFADMLAEAVASYDQVILDTPPLTIVTDAAILVPMVAGALVVVRADSTTRDAARAAIRSLRQVDGHILGCVVNDADLSEQGYGGKYYAAGNYYTYAAETE
jgi:succinoglycan biosynthesis transport protein ExoP